MYYSFFFLFIVIWIVQVRRGNSKKGSHWWVSHFWVGREYIQLWVSPPSPPQPPRELGRSKILLQLQREALSCQTGATLGMRRSRAESAFPNILSWYLLSSDKSIHTPDVRALSLAGPFGLALKAKEPRLKGCTVFPCGMEPILTTWKVLFLSVQQPTLALQAGTWCYS